MKERLDNRARLVPRESAANYRRLDAGDCGRGSRHEIHLRCLCIRTWREGDGASKGLRGREAGVSMRLLGREFSGLVQYGEKGLLCLRLPAE